MLSPCILDEKKKKGNQVESPLFLKGHDTEEDKPTSCSHPTAISLGGEGFLATQAANFMQSDY